MAQGTDPLNVEDYERLARESLGEDVHGYFAGGAGDELTLRENVEAYGRWHLRPRLLAGVDAADTSATVLGEKVALPLLVAPTAFHRLAHADAECATARAAQQAGSVMCLSTLATATPEEVAAAAPDGVRWFQLYCYRDRGLTRALVERAVESGYTALVLTADAPALGRRERDLRTGFAIPPEVSVPSFAAALGREAGATVAEIWELLDPAVTWKDVEDVRSLSDLPLLVKGILTAEDARLACESGAAGVVVSNHGGRQLDGVPATIDVLPEVVETVGGRGEVYLDGGVRRGADVVKALALGARAAMAGRAVLWGLAAGGEQGVVRVLELLREEIALALLLCGCASPADVTRAHVASAERRGA